MVPNRRKYDFFFCGCKLFYLNISTIQLNQAIGSIEAIAKASKEYILENTDLSVEKAERIRSFFRDPKLYLSPKINWYTRQEFGGEFSHILTLLLLPTLTLQFIRLIKQASLKFLKSLNSGTCQTFLQTLTQRKS